MFLILYVFFAILFTLLLVLQWFFIPSPSSLVPGSSRRTPLRARPSPDPDVRLSRIRLFVWLIFCRISVYSTLFSSKVVFLLCQSLSIAQVTSLVIAICGSLPSCGITHILQYYEAIRLPILPLLLIFRLSKHTPLLFSKVEKR